MPELPSWYPVPANREQVTNPYTSLMGSDELVKALLADRYPGADQDAAYWALLRQAYGGAPPDRVVDSPNGTYVPPDAGWFQRPVWGTFKPAWPPEYPVSPYTNPHVYGEEWGSGPDNPAISDAPPGRRYTPTVEPPGEGPLARYGRRRAG